ncbi:MAG TPA: hypothetical protein VD995_09035 [Azospirillum sp.]|nr:hypothetical protein [Azospirillum sp.]
MDILITGNMGHAGPVRIRYLRAQHPDARLIGRDSGSFGRCPTGVELLPDAQANVQHFGVVRRFPSELLAVSVLASSWGRYPTTPRATASM